MGFIFTVLAQMLLKDLCVFESMYIKRLRGPSLTFAFLNIILNIQYQISNIQILN